MQQYVLHSVMSCLLVANVYLLRELYLRCKREQFCMDHDFFAEFQYAYPFLSICNLVFWKLFVIRKTNSRR